MLPAACVVGRCPGRHWRAPFQAEGLQRLHGGDECQLEGCNGLMMAISLPRDGPTAVPGVGAGAEEEVGEGLPPLAHVDGT